MISGRVHDSANLKNMNFPKEIDNVNAPIITEKAERKRDSSIDES